MSKIKVGIVNYLNALPLLYGIQKEPFINNIELIIDYPAKIAGMLLEGSIDVGLVPVAIIPQMKEWHFANDYCIGTQGEVASVSLFSEVPIGNIEQVMLDYQSRSSVALLKYLLKEYWKVSPELVATNSESYINNIKDNIAGLIIGDRALENYSRFKYRYDLGTAWKNHTGLPFVFAAWISNKKLPDSFKLAFNEANAAGLNFIDAIVANTNYTGFDLRKYFVYHLNYLLDDAKHNGLHKFLNIITANVGVAAPL